MARLSQIHAATVSSLILSLVLSSITQNGFLSALNSPIRIHQQKSAAQKQLVIENGQTIESLTNLSAQFGSSLNQSTSFHRVRRQESNRQSSQIRSAKSQLQEPECPPSKLMQSLLPFEYIQSPASSGSQRQRHSKAHCDCTSDFLGWHLTCFVNSAGSGAQQRHQQPPRSAPAPVAAPATADNQELQLPNQLHPAFRAPQLQRQQQLAGAGANQRLQKRSAARWMGDLLAEQANPSSQAPLDNLPDSSSLNSPALSTSSAGSHEGFGEEPTSSASQAPESVAPRANDSNSPLASNKFKPSKSKLTSARVNFSSPTGAPSSQARDKSSSDHEEDPNRDFVSLSSSESMTLMASHGSNQLQQQQQQNSMFQTVPVLFSIKYVKNSMIEIDCDQAAPQYKPAMFQGFNVNEINSFTFNNCQLPNIPFSILLHRAKATQPLAANQSVGPQLKQLESFKQRAQNQNLLAKRKRRRTDEGTNENFDPILNNRADSNTNNELDSMQGFESRFQADGGAGEETLLAPEVGPAAHPEVGAEGQRQLRQERGHEPKIKSLSVNLNAVVEQRTLISLLTGLDLLEELQLNYLQLNVSSFEPDLDSDLSQTAPTSTTAEGELQAGNLAQPKPSQPTTTASPSSTTTTTPTTTTALPPVVTTSTSAGRIVPSINLAETRSALANNLQASAPATTPTSTSTTAAPTTTAASATATATTATTTIKPRLKGQANLLKPLHQTISTKPSSISIGAPRGLMIAQATGIPPTQTMAANQQQTTPAPLNNHSAPTTAAAATTTTTTAASTNSPATNQRLSGNSFQRPTSGSRNFENFNTIRAAGSGNMISVGSNQANSVTFTSNGNLMSPTSTAATTTTANNNNNFNAPPTSLASSTLLSSSQNQLSSNRIHHSPSAWFQAQPTTPANSFAGASAGPIPMAGSRLSAPSSVDSLAMQASDQFVSPGAGMNLNLPINTPPLNQQQQSGFGIRTTSTNLVPTTGNFRQQMASTSTQRQQQNQFQFQFQPTSPSSAASGSPTATLNSMQMGHSGPNFTTSPTTSQARRQPGVPQEASTTVNSIGPSNQFVAAGNRLSQAFKRQASPNSMGNQQRPQPTTNSLGIGEGFTAHQRFKRSSTSGGLNELELSFGELLPNLKSLKLESFIELAPPEAGANGRAPGSAIRRFKRQFKQSDLPERDDSDAHELDGLARPQSDDSLLAEESGIHHNSVMAPTSGAQATRASGEQPAEFDWSHEGPAGGSQLASNGSASLEPPNYPPAPPEDSTSSSRMKHLSLLLVKLFSRLNKLKILQLTSNNIPIWPDNVLFDSRASLKRLYLISNNMKLLSKNSFANLTELEILDLSSNQLRSLPGDLFSGLNNLKNFRACRNLFRKLPTKLFITMNSWRANGTQQQQQQQASNGKLPANQLEQVDLSKNRYLSQLSLDMFALQQQKSIIGSTTPITSLNLSDCLFSDQLVSASGPSQATGDQGPTARGAVEMFFGQLIDLTQLSLRNNKLKELLSINQLFSKNNRLLKLDFSHNQLSLISANLFNANASQLNELLLNHNQLTQIPEQFLFNLKKLKKLSLAHNKLTRLSPKMFLTNQLIEHLDLSHNQLISLNGQQSLTSASLIPFGNGANLKFINLAHNNLSSFNGEIFNIAWSFYTSLTHLDLSNNQFGDQISMPIFYTIADEMLLNLASNKIQSVSVEALVQHEQVLDRYASFEANSGSNQDAASRQTGVSGKVPTVNIKLTNNPISCDCMLEPLISYSRRIAAVTNPALMASIFAPAGAASRDSAPPPASSKYSMLNNQELGPLQQAEANQQRQAQLLYQFKLNDLYCAKPSGLRRRLISHVSIGDLLCDIQDERLCPKACACFYQSAFKTAIVDCNNKQLSSIPHQLTDARNFRSVLIESLADPEAGHQTVGNLEKIIIRLDNNQLTSIDELSKLFTLVSRPTNNFSTNKSRFARESKPPPTSSTIAQNLAAPPTPEAQAQSRSGAGERAQQRKMISPVAVGRNMHNFQQAYSRQVRTRRQLEADFGPLEPTGSEIYSNESEAGSNSSSAMSTTASGGGEQPALMSTAVLESAEEFRERKYPLTCELYLDNNLIEKLPDSFLEMLDQIKFSNMEQSLIPPQAALPSSMLEPPVHAKISSEHLMLEPLKMSASSTLSSIINGDEPSAAEENSATNLFGPKQRLPALNSQRIAKLMETINENVSKNRVLVQQEEPTTIGKLSVTPTLAVLSLRHNALSKINARMLYRLGKLIRSSNTKLYLGHNPYNCSENFAPTSEAEEEQRAKRLDGTVLPLANQLSPERPEMVPAAPMGDKLISASDSSSGAYLEPSADDNGAANDLAASASDPQASSSEASQQGGGHSQPLEPANCPVGQLKSWLTRHHANIGDLDELYCVQLGQDLADKLKLANGSAHPGPAVRLPGSQQRGQRHEHEHPWTSSPPLLNGSREANGSDSGRAWLRKNGLAWNGDLLMQTSKLIDLNIYDLCPYSNIQLLEAQQASGLLSPVHQQILMSVSALFILISLCLLLMLVYFGDTQTILAFVYIHLNPLYSCLRLNETHLDGDKLYDAFVSYSSADRDIVMELIEKLEQQASGHSGSSSELQNGRSKPPNYGANSANLNPNYARQNYGAKNILDRSQDSLVTEADLSGTLNRRGESGNSQTASSASFQDFNTMSRSTSRISIPEVESSSTSSSSQQLSNSNFGQLQDKKQIPYRLCIHERDWLPGHLISWNIVNSVQNSRRTILILSKEFIKSVWFQVEFHTAYYQMLEDKIDRLIVIVRGDLPPKNELDKNLAFLLTTKTYLTWGEKWFWERLHYALPHRSNPPLVLGKQLPIKQHHHHKPNGATSKSNLAALTQNQTQQQQQQQRPLVMSSIGKDCSNLLLPAHHNQQAPIMIGSSSSSGSATSAARSSASFLSGSSTGNLLSPKGATAATAETTATTANDLLSTSTGDCAPRLQQSSTRVMINSAKSSQELIDSGRITGSSGSMINSPEVTSILLEQPQQVNSKLRAKKQEKLQNFVDKNISNHFNLSEL